MPRNAGSAADGSESDESGESSSDLNKLESTWTILHTLLHKDQAIPDTCIFTIIGCFSVLITSTSPVWKHTLKDPDGARWMGKAYELAMNRVTAPRTVADIQRLKMLKCRCRSAVRIFRTAEKDRDALHATGVAYHQETAKAIGLPKTQSPIVSLLEVVLEPPTMLLERNLVPHRLRLRTIPKRSTWPTSIEHMLPRGPADTIQGLLAWFQLDDLFHSKFGLLNTILSLIRTCQVYVIPHLITSRIFLEDGLLRGIDILHLAVHSGTAPKTSYRSKVALVSVLSELIGSFLIPGLDITQRRLFLHGFEGKVVQAISRFINTCDMLYRHDVSSILASASQRNQISLALATAKYFAALVHIESDNPREYLSTLDPVFVQDIEIVRRHIFADVKTASWRRFVRVMYRMDEADRCYNPNCTSSWTHAHETLRVCRGCLRVTYCSRRCQARAWSDSTCGHRDACVHIRTLCQRWKIQRRPVFMQVAIIDSKKTIVPDEHEYSLVKKINEHFSRLATLEMQSWSELNDSNGFTARFS